MERLKADYPAVQTYERGERITRLYGAPFGYGTSPEETALSIMGEMVAVRNGHDGGRLGAIKGRIHGGDG